jgi:hypothetical protein
MTQALYAHMNKKLVHHGGAGEGGSRERFTSWPPGSRETGGGHKVLPGACPL